MAKWKFPRCEYAVASEVAQAALDSTNATDALLEEYRRSIDERKLWDARTMPRRVFAELCEAIGAQAARTATKIMCFKVQGDCTSNVVENSKNA